MSKVFYDHLVNLDKVDEHIKKIAQTPEEKEELWQIVDEIVHHRIIGCVLERLPSHHHDQFLSLLNDRPHDEGILDYLADKIKGDVKEFIRLEALNLGYEILDQLSLRSMPKQSVSTHDPKK